MPLFLALSDTIPMATNRYLYRQASERCFEK
jgi:hypothetical protein